MKTVTKLLIAVAAALVLATSAQAQEAQPEGASNLGTAVVGSSQQGMFGGMGANGMGVAIMAVMFGVYAIMANESEDTVQPPPPPFRDPEPLPEPPTHH